jgi:hypothetical protein
MMPTNKKKEQKIKASEKFMSRISRNIRPMLRFCRRHRVPCVERYFSARGFLSSFPIFISLLGLCARRLPCNLFYWQATLRLLSPMFQSEAGSEFCELVFCYFVVAARFERVKRPVNRNTASLDAYGDINPTTDTFLLLHAESPRSPLQVPPRIENRNSECGSGAMRCIVAIIMQ